MSKVNFLKNLRSRFETSRWFAPIALGCVALIAAVFWFDQSNVPVESNDQMRELVKQVRARQAKQLAPQVVVTSYRDIATKFPELGFDPKPTDGVLLDTYNLIGASQIQVIDRTALDLTLQHKPSGSNTSLIVMPYTKDMSIFKSTSFPKKETYFHIWKRDGKLFVFKRAYVLPSEPLDKSRVQSQSKGTRSPQ